jgi:hypothetical protein
MPLERLRRAWAALDGRQRAAVAVWAIALVLLGGKALLWPHRNSVYPIFAGAGRAWRVSGNLYEPPSGQEAYRYSPLVAAFFVPFGLLPDGPGGLLWRLLGSAVFLGGLAWWCRVVLPPGLVRKHWPLLLLLPAPLTLGNIHNGQANLLVMGLLLVAVAAVAAGRLNTAAACLAVACAFKLYPIAVALLLVTLDVRRLGPRLALALAAGFLLPFLLQRPGYVAAQYADWLGQMARNDRQVMPQECWYRDARLLCSRWVVPMSYGAYQTAEVIGGGIIAAAGLWARRAGLARPPLLALLLGLGCCWMTALGPATESSTYILLGPTAAWLLLAGAAEGHPVGLRAAWLTGYGLLVVAQAASVLPAGWGRSLQALGPQPLGALLILGGLLYLAFRGAAPSLSCHPASAALRMASVTFRSDS